jgi:predicted Zn-dependent peptidase
MDFKLTKLENGLKIITIPVPTSESVTITFWVGVGSRAETDKIAGLSHFVEHMVFKGSVKRPTAKDIAEAVDGFGGEMNAGTTKEWTNFYIKAAKGNIKLAFDVLYDIVINPILDEKEIEREKGVIVEEMAMYEDTPLFKIPDIFENLIYSGDNLGRDIIGNAKTVRSLNRNDFLRYREAHYYTDNIVVTVSGGINEKEIIDLCSKYFSTLKKKGDIEERNYHFKDSQIKPRVLLKTKKNEQAHLMMGFIAGKKGNEDRYAEAVLAAILGQGMSSRMFTEVRERRGLAYAVRTSIDRYVDTGAFVTYAGVELSKIDDAIRVILDEHLKLAVAKPVLSDKEFTKAKEFIKGHFALSIEDTRDINSLFGESELLMGKVETPEEILKGIEKVTKDDVLRVAKKIFDKNKVNLAIIGPFEDEERFVKILES